MEVFDIFCWWGSLIAHFSIMNLRSTFVCKGGAQMTQKKVLNRNSAIIVWWWKTIRVHNGSQNPNGFELKSELMSMGTQNSYWWIVGNTINFCTASSYSRATFSSRSNFNADILVTNWCNIFDMKAHLLDLWWPI